MKKVTTLFTCMTFMFPLSAEAQLNAQIKEQLRACQAAKIKEKMVREKFSAENGVTCRAGQINNFRCDKQDKDGSVSYSAPTTHRIVSAQKTNLSKTDRGGIGNITFNERTANVPLSCRGNGCDKGDREWAKARISGEIEKIPTADDARRAMDECLEEILK